MMVLGNMAITAPWVLGLLAALPIIWFIVRALPPKPKQVSFPPLMLILKLKGGDPTPDTSPLWILLLRMTIAGLIILALSGPILNPTEALKGSGPITILVDNGWESARHWDKRTEALKEILDKATREQRPVRIITTAPKIGSQPQNSNSRNNPINLPDLLPARDWLAKLGTIQPLPFSPDHHRAGRQLEQLSGDNSTIIWLSDGLNHVGTESLTTSIQSFNDVSVRMNAAKNHPLALLPASLNGLDITLTLERPTGSAAEPVKMRAYGKDGRRLSDVDLLFEAGETTTTTTLSLPQAQRNDLGRIDVLNGNSAGTTLLLDARQSRPLIGLVTDENIIATPTLKTARYYLDRALENQTALIEGSLEEILESEVTLLFLGDVGRLNTSRVIRLRRWIAEGGVVVRFSGPKMENGVDPLVPVRLKLGNRSFGGAMTWDTPKPLAPFSKTSPFFGLPISPEVNITRQILASPDLELANRTWAALVDGTPLVTARSEQKGWMILFHTTANTDWSNLVLSGMFPQMLERLLPFANSNYKSTTINDLTALKPTSVLNGYGVLTPPPNTAGLSFEAISLETINSKGPSPEMPAGYWGPSSNPYAFNLMGPMGSITQSYSFTPLDSGGLSVKDGLATRAEQSLTPLLLSLALTLTLLDILAALYLRGNLSFKGSKVTASIMVIIIAGGFIYAAPTLAQQKDGELNDSTVREATRQTRLAYVPTGNPEQDKIIEAGLRGLGLMIRLRTSVRLSPAFAMDVDKDELKLYPFIYWPITASSPPLSDHAAQRVSKYLETGGMILFDLGIGDPAENSMGLTNPETQAALQALTARLNIPSLVRVGSSHVLSKSYYLLNSFPGRITGRNIWAEKRSDGPKGRVSGVIIGSHDWASAWALDRNTRPLVYPLSGGQRQREMAFRFGINMVMYALTGTYKNDSIHMNTLLQRLKN
jgi:hypothetical protein